VKYVPIGRIKVPRDFEVSYACQHFLELCRSIREKGFLTENPLVVLLDTTTGEGGDTGCGAGDKLYLLVQGFRRYAAAKSLYQESNGHMLANIPCHVVVEKTGQQSSDNDASGRLMPYLVNQYFVQQATTGVNRMGFDLAVLSYIMKSNPQIQSEKYQKRVASAVADQICAMAPLQNTGLKNAMNKYWLKVYTVFQLRPVVVEFITRLSSLEGFPWQVVMTDSFINFTGSFKVQTDWLARWLSRERGSGDNALHLWNGAVAMNRTYEERCLRAIADAAQKPSPLKNPPQVIEETETVVEIEIVATEEQLARFRAAKRKAARSLGPGQQHQKTMEKVRALSLSLSLSCAADERRE